MVLKLGGGSGSKIKERIHLQAFGTPFMLSLESYLVTFGNWVIINN